MASLAVSPVAAVDEVQLAQVRAIYEDAFSPELRVPFAELTQAGEADQTFVALDGAEAVGFAALRLLGSAQWSFLRYFAIAPARRGRGLGREFWRLLADCAGRQGWPGRMVFEVEDPGDAAGDDHERLVRQRRVAFWTRCGARLLPAPGYVLPDYTGAGVTEPMLLMAGSSGQARAPVVAGDDLRRLVLAIYTDRYRLPVDHPLVAGALASIST